jgi:hypothetical protein
MIAVSSDPPGGAAAAGVTVTKGNAIIVSAMNSARDVRLVFVKILSPNF